MTRQILAVVTVGSVAVGLMLANKKQSGESAPFERATVYFEQNATDEDAEVVFEADTGDLGLASLKVVSPDGRTIIDFKAPNSKLAIRHFRFESPELENDGIVQADFPEGEYTFTGTTVTGVKLHGNATLSHKLPDTASVIKPAPDEDGVPIKGLEITWSPVKNLAAYIVTIEQEELAHAISARLPATVTTFAVPDGFLIPQTEYKLAIGTVTKDGNTSFVETSFTTAATD